MEGLSPWSRNNFTGAEAATVLYGAVFLKANGYETKMRFAMTGKATMAMVLWSRITQKQR